MFSKITSRAEIIFAKSNVIGLFDLTELMTGSFLLISFVSFFISVVCFFEIIELSTLFF